ncbi:MAG: hypothetical protein KGD59_06835 [Candidatus Heimdallarchaeota archaeon]|nr:hypothetical protein [Candidatus Heimdallarchaeota archaeon]MBY8994249.1 hypothetical protein [Candidatus Heimdallarchaeota archaeon]
MERKKIYTLLFLTVFAITLCCQVSNHKVSSAKIISEEPFQTANTKPVNGISPSAPTLNALFNSSLFNQSAQPKIWFYLNIVLVVLLPIVFIVQTILDKRSKGNPTASKLDEEEAVEETRTETIAPPKNNLLHLVRYSFLTLFIQNIAILVVLIVILVTSFQLNPQLSQTLTQIYSIMYHIDFIAAILAAIGLILIAPTVKRRVQSYVAAGFWIAWIGLGIYPRINLIGNTGIFGAFDPLDFIAWGLNFYGSDLFLITFGSIALAFALFYTANVLVDDGYIRGKGMLNSFGITNAIIGAGFSIILLSLLTFGGTMTDETLLSIGILWVIFIFGKFLIGPVVGIIAGIVVFRQIKPEKIS